MDVIFNWLSDLLATIFEFVGQVGDIDLETVGIFDAIVEFFSNLFA